MAITVKHKFVSAIPDAGDPTIVQPSNWNDDHDLVGTIPVANGGTGASTANGGFNALAPSQTGNSGKYLTTDGTNTSWSANAGGDVVGPASATDNAVARFDTTTGKLIQNSLTTIDDTGILATSKGLIGSGANFTDYPSAQFVSTQSKISGYGHAYKIGVVGEAQASSSDSNIWGIGVHGRGWTNNATRCAGLEGDAGVTNSADTGTATAVRANSTSTHSGGLNIGLTIDASGSSVNNYAIYMINGNLYSAAAQTWELVDNSNSALVFNSVGKTGILDIITTNGAEGISTSGTLTATGTTSLGTLGVTGTSTLSNVAITGTTSFDGSEGTAGQVLTSAGTGVTPTWATPTTGTVTSIATGTGLTGGPITTSGTISIDSTVATLTGTQTLTNKTLTSPKVNEILDTNGNEILGLSPTTSATDYLTVKNGIGVGVPLHVYADGSSTNVGLHIQPKGSGLVTISDGTDFNKGIRFRSSGSAASAITLLDAVATAGRVVTLPDATTTLVGRDTTDTLTNKSISGSTNTLSNIGNASLTNSAITINGTSTSLGGSISVGTVTSVTGTAPVVSSGGATPAISMPAATTSVSGYLTSTDWNTFNGKSNTNGTVTSVGGTGTVNGLTLTGTVTTSGNLTLGGTLDLSSPPAIGGTTASAITGTTITANTQFTGAGTGLTGTATSLSIGGNAATVTNGVVTTGSYADPTWITSLAGSKISGTIDGGTF
jgi:hypothetical protein